MQVEIDELVQLFDALPDVVFFAKDAAGRYTHVNLTLLRRLRLASREEVVGKSVEELFPAFMGGGYASQDRRVLRGELVENQLEVHIFEDRAPGWCITFKRPLRVAGQIRGLIGISRDLKLPDGQHPTYGRVRRALAHMQAHYGERIRVTALAEQAAMSVAQLERHFRHVFQLTPQQMLTKLRIEAAMEQLRGDGSIAAIGQACGFGDQSAFARQFKLTTSLTPRDYRKLHRATPQQHPARDGSE